jgi:6-phosphogluconolactonase
MPSALFYVGCVNRPIGYVKKVAGKGISAYRLDLETGTAQFLGLTEGIDNPTFVDVAPDGKSLSAISEVAGWNEGDISAYAIDYNSGALTYLSKQPTRGDGPTHNSHDASGRFAAIANYSGLPAEARPNQSVAIYPRDPDGTLRPPVSEARHHGTGPDTARQERPHAHCIRWTPDNRFVVVADLGIDRLVIYRFDEDSGALTRHGETVLPPGSGPRHFRFHPSLPFAYLVNELSCTLVSLRFDAQAGTFEILASEPTTPQPVQGNSGSAIDIAAGGQHLYVGNRGDDSIAGFSIDQSTGIAHRIGNTPCGGHVPRDFAFDPTGQILVVANQESDVLSLFRYVPASGALEPFGTPIPSGSPTAIAFHPQIG